MKIRIAVATVVAVALAAAGVAAAAAVTHQSAGSKGTVMLHQTNLGKVLATKSGMTLYLFKADHGRTSACYGQCAGYWPPLLVKGKPSAGAGVKAKLLGTIKRKNGTHQVTYAGHPLYRYKADTQAGQATGEGQDFFGGKWYGVNSSGKAVTHAQAGGGGGTTTTTTYPTTTTPYP
jgi:predicted lipoprotein with Yx(FWY)xxD motif